MFRCAQSQAPLCQRVCQSSRSRQSRQATESIDCRFTRPSSRHASCSRPGDAAWKNFIMDRVSNALNVCSICLLVFSSGGSASDPGQECDEES